MSCLLLWISVPEEDSGHVKFNSIAVDCNYLFIFPVFLCNAQMLRGVKSSHHLLWRPLRWPLGIRQSSCSTVQSVSINDTWPVQTDVGWKMQKDQMRHWLKQTWGCCVVPHSASGKERPKTWLLHKPPGVLMWPPYPGACSVVLMSSILVIYSHKIHLSGFHTASNWNKFWIVALLRDSERWNEGYESCSHSNVTKIRKAAMVLCGWETHFLSSVNWLEIFIRSFL